MIGYRSLMQNIKEELELIFQLKPEEFFLEEYSRENFEKLLRNPDIKSYVCVSWLEDVSNKPLFYEIIIADVTDAWASYPLEPGKGCAAVFRDLGNTCNFTCADSINVNWSVYENFLLMKCSNNDLVRKIANEMFDEAVWEGKPEKDPEWSLLYHPKNDEIVVKSLEKILRYLETQNSAAELKLQSSLP